MPPPKDPKKYAEWLRKNKESHIGKPSAFKGKHHTEEAKAKNREKHLGINKSESTKKLMSDSHRGQIPWNKDKTGIYSEDRLQELRVQMTGNQHASGSKHTDEWKKSQSERNSGENNPFHNKTHNEKTRLIISKTNTGKKYALGYRHTEKTKARLKITRMNQVFPQKDTKPEKIMQIALTLRGIKFAKHKAVFGQPDIFIEPNLCIFVDGNYWHNRPEVKIRDSEVNKTLLKQGYEIIRVWEKDIKNNADKCVDNILSKFT